VVDDPVHDGMVGEERDDLQVIRKCRWGWKFAAFWTFSTSSGVSSFSICFSGLSRPRRSIRSPDEVFRQGRSVIPGRGIFSRGCVFQNMFF
jgi:hypothetical protein